MKNPTNCGGSVADFDHSTNSFCSALVPSSIPRNQWEGTSTKLLEVASRLRFTANRFVPINQLSLEVLCEVFSHLRPIIGGEPKKEPKKLQSKRLPFRDLLAATHTCQHWRRTAITAPKLWSSLSVRSSNRTLNDLARLFIHRSGQLPLDAAVGQGLDAIIPYTPRLRTLSCTPSIQDLSALHEHPVPLLETLHIVSHPEYLPTAPLPALFNGDTPSLRALDMEGFDPFPKNNFHGLSSFRLRLSFKGYDNPTFLAQLFTVLRNSPQLEELFLRLHSYHDDPSIESISTPVDLLSLQRLHFWDLTSALARQLLKSIRFPPRGISMRFTGIPHFDWIPPPTLPLDLSFHVMTSLEIVYLNTARFVIQGANNQMQIRVLENGSTSLVTRADVFSHITPPINLLHPLRELWVHIGRKMALVLPLSKFPNLEKLVVRAESGGDLIRRALRELEITDNHVPCPLLSTLDLSGAVDVKLLAEVLGDRSRAGHRLRVLRLGGAHAPGKGIKWLRVGDCVSRLEVFDVDAEPGGMELPAVCTTELGEWWQPWIPEGTTLVDGRAYRV